jgi:hypothetical protein
MPSIPVGFVEALYEVDDGVEIVLSPGILGVTVE